MSNQKNNRRIFRIEVGNMPDNDIQDYIQKLKDSFKKQPLFIDASNNVYKRELLIECATSYKRFLKKYNPLNIEEDYFISFR